MRFASRISRIEPSITLELDARAKALQGRGENVVNMAVGEPDFPAPRVVQAAAVEKVLSGDVRYTQAAGTPSLREALARHLEATRGSRWDPAEITVCHSAKHALSGSLYALADHGDDVLVPLPAWASYFDLVRLAGAQPLLVPGRMDADGIHPDLDGLRKAVTPRTRMILLNSPNNPSGSVWSRTETEEVVRFALEHELLILSDEIYRALVYEGEPATSPASLSAEARAHTVIIDGASKGFAMTGYRIGFLAGPKEVASAVAKLHSQTTGSPNAVSQAAYERALLSPPPEMEIMRRTFAERRTLLLDGLRGLGLPTPNPRGAFYAFPDVSAHLDARGSVGFCEALLDEQRLALVPGAAFGMDTHVRLSYATDVATIREALKRLASFLARRGR
jgi:aspartate aminotransferase